MDVAFDPLALTKDASLNRTLLADLPGADPQLVGRAARSVLSLKALQSLAADHGVNVAERLEVPRRLSNALGSSEAATADQARQVIADFGRCLGHLVATLRLGFEDASPWRAAYLEYWKSVERIWLGGGIAAALGNELLQSTRSEAVRLGLDGSTIDLSSHADVLALIGAARTCAGGAERAIVLDFGYSSVKRGIASFRAGGLQRLDVLRSLPSPPSAPAVPRYVLGVIRRTFFEAQPVDIEPEVVVSVATYVDDWQATAAAEAYDLLRGVNFEAELERLTSVPLRVRFMHDGTAAAAGLATNGRDGIIVLGSSLGAGFTVLEQQRLPIANDLIVRRA